MTLRPGSHHKGTDFEVRHWEGDAGAGAPPKAFGRAKPRGSSRAPAPPQPLQRHPSDSKPRRKAGSMPSYFSAQRGKRKKQTLPLRAGRETAEVSTCQAERGAAEVNAAACGEALPAAGAGPACCWLAQAPRAHAASSPKLHQAAWGAARRRAARPRERRPAWKSGRGRRDEPEGKRLQLL